MSIQLRKTRYLFLIATLVIPFGLAGDTITFEDLPDTYFFSSGDQNIGNYYPGVTFGLDVTGLSVSRFGGYDNSGFPPHSGDVAIWDAADPTITISFDAPISSFGIWYTTYDPLVLDAYDASGNLLGTDTGNPNTDGTTGTSSYLTFSDAGVESVTLTSTPGFFVLDDLTFQTETASVPEPQHTVFVAVGLMALVIPLASLLSRKRSRPKRTRCDERSLTLMIRLGKPILLLYIAAVCPRLWAQSWSWMELATLGGPVSGREAPSAVYDPSSNRLVVFGGSALDLPCCDNSLNEVWVLTNANGNGGAPTWIQLTPNAPSGFPAARTDLSAAYDSVNNRMIIFGGGQFGPSVFHALFNDVWVLTNANGLGGVPTWVPLTPSGGPPPARAGHQAVYDANNNRMIVYGGGNNGIEDVSTDVWVLTNANGLGGSPAWLQFSPTGSPHAEEHYATGYDPNSNEMIFFGGCCYYTNASTILTNANGIGGPLQWIALSPSGTVPAIRQTPAYGYNPTDNSLLIFGVSGPGGAYNDTWELLNANGVGAPSWVNLIPNGEPNSPPINSGFNTSSASGFDVANRRLISLENIPLSGGGSELQAWVLAPASPLQPPPPLNSTFGVGSTSSNQTATTSEPINTATGDYYLSHADVTVPGKGLSFNFTRSYNSLDSYSGPLGSGWTHSFNILLTIDAASGTISIKEPDGHQDLFTSLGSGAYAAALTGLHDTLVGNSDGSFSLTRKNQTVFNFSAPGALTSVVDRNGHTQTLNYDGAGNLASVVDTAGRTFTFAHDGSGRITSLADPIGRTWTYAYDANGNLVSVTDAAGGVTQYTYDANHRMLTAIDARGTTFLQNAYDSQGRVVTQTNARNFATTLAYNSPSVGTTTFTDPLGNSTQHVYDGALRLIKVIDAKGGTVSYIYDANNDRIAITNQNGNTVNMAYDGQGNVTGITDPLGNVQSFTYDSKNDLLTATNPKAATTTFSYDSNGNLLGIKDAAGDTTTFTYNSGLLSSKTDARGNTTAYGYDSAGDLTRVTDALSNATTLTYDGIGRLLSTTDPNGHSASVAYDVLSRIMKTTDALNNATEFSYDAIGNLLKITDANGNSTSYAYDGTNDLASVTDAGGKITSYGYDANDNRTSFTNAKSNTTSYAFDALNRLVQIIDPLTFTTSYAYDAVGNTVATIDANGKTNQYAYDILNRLIKGSYADGSTVSYAYDQDGNRTTMNDSRGDTTYTYDALDRVLSVTSPNSSAVHYSYDSIGNRTSLGYPDGRTVQYQYDALNRLSQVTDWAGKTTQYSYDLASNLQGFTYPNGASSAYTFDAANRLLEIVNSSGGKVLSSFTYALDSVGNRLQVTSAASGTTKYGYDPLYRLTSWTAPSGQPTQYTYDPVGNRLSMVSSAGTTPYTYDSDDRMLSAGTTSYVYDKNGNQISKTTGSTTVSYSYDALNRLTAASGGGINSQYQYDGDGNRVAQIVSTGTYQYLNDTATALPVVLNEAGPDGNIDDLYGISMISETSSAFQYFYQSDALGSTASLTDATGALKASYSYDPWGKLLVPIDPLGTKNKYKFTGEALDPGTALYYMRARQYDPTFGRFTTLDPLYGFVGFPQSLNRYEYGIDSPMLFNDPGGRTAIDSESLENNQSTITLAQLSTSRCNTTCTSSLVENLGTVISLAAPLSSIAKNVSVFYPIYEVPFELESQLANGASRGTAVINTFTGQLLNTGLPLLALKLFGGEADIAVTVAIYAFNYNLPTAQ